MTRPQKQDLEQANMSSHAVSIYLKVKDYKNKTNVDTEHEQDKF